MSPTVRIASHATWAAEFAGRSIVTCPVGGMMLRLVTATKAMKPFTQIGPTV
ncbi:hypothetical protein [Nonomuraea guangzhouensis]|uniref:Uncharacterized protein n=1 Tax=Nonomuraea guangzhouensis TaxID=1291555 RepID=A0ABW4G6T5_9ACTN|nr:hypothetical protein [Nonomuraea guangzhouensis]